MISAETSSPSPDMDLAMAFAISVERADPAKVRTVNLLTCPNQGRYFGDKDDTTSAFVDNPKIPRATAMYVLIMQVLSHIEASTPSGHVTRLSNFRKAGSKIPAGPHAKSANSEPRLPTLA